MKSFSSTQDEVKYHWNDPNWVGAKINWEELNNLIGRMLTHIDATYTDVEQRTAQKQEVKNTIINWYERLERIQNPELASKHPYITI